MMHIVIAMVACVAQDTDEPSRWGWADFGSDEFSGVRARASYLHWSGFGVGDDLALDSGVRVNPDDFSADLWGAAIGVMFERFEFEIEYLDGTGEGDAEGDIDFDVEIQAARLSVSRPIWGYDGDRFDLFLGASLAVLYLRQTFDGFTGLPDSEDRNDVFFGASGWLGAYFQFSDEGPAAFLRGEVGHYLGDSGGLEVRISLGVEYRF